MKKEISSGAGFVFVVIGLLLIVLGISNGEVGSMFEKSVRICLECIGIG